MSLFDLQDVCIAIGSIATLDLPMVVDLIGIYGLKGPYSTLRSLPRAMAGRTGAAGRRLLALWRDDGRPMHAAGLHAKLCALVAAVRRSMAHDARDCAALIA
ncbi:hypothetical protein F511_36739 [Dorcoceras hygrometricum]|uniref:Uncharacterized protein n=1 Tax=Dorcoceras hygrometricum TaxID=472368 RepID=A0A2Z7B7Z7_9LAMI|nr:hypothetical protein F511_36739 [Dorcoceras hygrometricum]